MVNNQNIKDNRRQVKSCFHTLILIFTLFSLPAFSQQYLDAQEGGFVLNKNTGIYLPPNSLCYSNGTLVTGKIRVETKEYYKSADLLQLGINTYCDNTLLVTGYLMDVQIFAGDSLLHIAPDKHYSIFFKRDIIGYTHKGASLYLGNTEAGEIVNFTEAPEDVNLSRDKELIAQKENVDTYIMKFYLYGQPDQITTLCQEDQVVDYSDYSEAFSAEQAQEYYSSHQSFFEKTANTKFSERYKLFGSSSLPYYSGVIGPNRKAINLKLHNTNHPDIELYEKMLEPFKTQTIAVMKPGDSFKVYLKPDKQVDPTKLTDLLYFNERDSIPIKSYAYEIYRTNQLGVLGLCNKVKTPLPRSLNITMTDNEGVDLYYTYQHTNIFIKGKRENEGFSFKQLPTIYDEESYPPFLIGIKYEGNFVYLARIEISESNKQLIKLDSFEKVPISRMAEKLKDFGVD